MKIITSNIGPISQMSITCSHASSAQGVRIIGKLRGNSLDPLAGAASAEVNMEWVDGMRVDAILLGKQNSNQR
ncbi:MAG: hypothetical protein QF579_05715 [Dehalococcoidia bacterium]|jgi:hypothetical protein|nr:hypothetical protein [Dehalococcoidia bacterium]